MNFFEILFLIFVVGWMPAVFIYGMCSGMSRKPKPPERTIWGCGWSNPLPNPTYREEYDAYLADMAEWRRKRNR